MKKLIILSTCVFFISSFSSCKKDRDIKPEDEFLGHFTFKALTVASNPSNYTKSKTITTVNNFWAEIKEVNGTNELTIYHGDQYNNTAITVDFTGVGNYSSDNTNLQCYMRSYNGQTNPTYRFLTSPKGTGGYMEIISNENGTIKGNIRFIVGYRDVISNSYKYRGIDDGLFEIKLR